MVRHMLGAMAGKRLDRPEKPVTVHELARSVPDTNENKIHTQVKRLRQTVPMIVEAVSAGHSGKVGNISLVVRREAILEELRKEAIISVINDLHDDRAGRIVRMLLHHHQLEDKQISDIALIPPKDTRAMLFTMLTNRFVHAQDVATTADHAPKNTFYTWSVPLDRVQEEVKERICKSILNLRTRKAHLMERLEEEDLGNYETMFSSAIHQLDHMLLVLSWGTFVSPEKKITDRAEAEKAKKKAKP